MDESDCDLGNMGKTEYENYLNLSALLGCQKSLDTCAHADELLFQVTHQTAELWMKVEAHELTRVQQYLEEEKSLEAVSLLHRVASIHQVLTQQITILESMSPWDYQKIRKTLGTGSGLDSPGFQALCAILPTIWSAFVALLQRQNIVIDCVFIKQENHYPIFLLAEALVTVDERFQTWCFQHLKLVEREIGGKVKSLKEQPTGFLRENIHRRFFPDLWEVRNRLTERARPSI